MCHDPLYEKQGKALECVMILFVINKEGCSGCHDPLYEKQGKAVECVMILCVINKGRL